MNWWGYPNYNSWGCGCDNNNDGNNWIWIIIVIFVLFYIFRDNNCCHNR